MSTGENAAKISRVQVQSDATRGGPGALNPTAMTLEQAARVLSAMGARHVAVEDLRQDIEAGAPVNADGTVNLVHLAAWLVKELANRGD